MASPGVNFYTCMIFAPVRYLRSKVDCLCNTFASQTALEGAYFELRSCESSRVLGKLFFKLISRFHCAAYIHGRQTQLQS